MARELVVKSLILVTLAAIYYRDLSYYSSTATSANQTDKEKTIGTTSINTESSSQYSENIASSASAFEDASIDAEFIIPTTTDSPIDISTTTKDNKLYISYCTA